MVQIKTNLLKRKASRWLTRPEGDQTTGPNIDPNMDKFSFLVYLRDLNMNPVQNTAFATALNGVDGSDKSPTLAHAVAKAVGGMQRIGYDYRVMENGKRRRVDVYGEPEAMKHLGEHDQLIDLARTVWTDPHDTTDFIGQAHEKNIRAMPPVGPPTIDTLFQWARSWGEVRYRFMDHALRDDPVFNRMYSERAARSKGDHANVIVHESNVTEDSKLVEIKAIDNIGYTEKDRRIFENMYKITPEEGRQLGRYCCCEVKLRGGLREVFLVCAAYIDSYMDWRVKVLTLARYSNLNATRKLPVAKRQAEMDRLHKISAGQIQDADDVYINEFVPTLRAMLDEAAQQNALTQVSCEALTSAIENMKKKLCKSPFNSRFHELKTDSHVRKILNQFPGRQLRMPTGTSIIKKSRR